MTALDPGDFAHDDEQQHATYEDPDAAAQANKDRQHDHHHRLIASDVADLEAVATDLNTALLGAKDLTFPELLTLLNRTEVAMQALGSSLASLKLAAWRARGDHYGDLELDGLPLVTLRRTSTRKRWEDRAVVDAVLDRQLAALEGDIPPAWDVADWLLDAAHVDYWRVGKLKALGLDPDDYCETVQGNPAIDFQRSGDNPLLAGDTDG